MIELAVDNTNVIEIPCGNLMDIAGMARRFADDIDADTYGEPNRAIVIVETEEGLRILSWGENTTPYEMMGLLEAAKLTAFADNIIDD